MTPSVEKSYPYATRSDAICVQLLGLIGLGLFITAALLVSTDSYKFICKDHDMFIKILGLLCAAVFVGATLMEAKHLHKHKRKRKSAERLETDSAIQVAPVQDAGLKDGND
jgi:hypothetical protein